MLFTLRIQDLVLVDKLEIDLSPGLNVMTGETGAGKSILLKGLDLLSGGKGGAELIRAGAERCLIEGAFVVDKVMLEHLSESAPDLVEFFEDEELILRRTLERTGRSKVTANGKMLSRGEAAHLASCLFDITGQHQNQSLLDSSEHITLLDRFGVPKQIIEEVRKLYTEFSFHRKRLDEFRKTSGDKEEYFRRLRFEADEINQTRLVVGEKEELEVELKRLANAEYLIQTAQQLEEAFDDETDGLLAKLGSVIHVLENARRKDSGLQELFELVQTSGIQLNEAKRTLDEYGHRLEADPNRIEILRERLSELARLERKYGKSIPELIEYCQQISQELGEFESGALDLDSLEKAFSHAREQLTKSEKQLTAARMKVASTLASSVERELADLAMNKARFEVRISSTDSTSSGADDVEFTFSANPGTSMQPLQKVASGGELSRVLLILKTLLNEQRDSFLQVFDEIDSGVGGAVAQIVGEKIKSLTPRYQVLIVTHAPQVAAFAERHFLIEKRSDSDQTLTTVRPLTDDEQLAEIARMLAGKKVSAHFEQSARELISHGRANQKSTPKASGNRSRIGLVFQKKNL